MGRIRQTCSVEQRSGVDGLESAHTCIDTGSSTGSAAPFALGRARSDNKSKASVAGSSEVVAVGSCSRSLKSSSGVGVYGAWALAGCEPACTLSTAS